MWYDGVKIGASIEHRLNKFLNLGCGNTNSAYSAVLGQKVCDYNGIFGVRLHMQNVEMPSTPGALSSLLSDTSEYYS